ncbi:hypothetical protein [Geobacter sp. DSM 9736]|uniref:hypothetical protein n=1 Tax=Geobacter sp. DSM 9736 TaxID=1277350 RepID=UPI000B5E1E57|nr:hypothetical protein [Geobacter sp. DSM 9736]SNB45365.1 hypothetical protein SAMN06269301_0778 [Geobacter sp. DSM 9736]
MLAFRSEKSADDFVKAFGGKRFSFDEALKASYLDMDIREKAAGKAAGRCAAPKL